MKINTVVGLAKQTILSYFRDRLFHASIIFSVLFILFCYFLATLTIVESQKILLDFGFAALSMSGIFAALLIGITLCGKEFEKRTIYSVLSKPIERGEYLVGKFFGGLLALTFFQLLNFSMLSFMIWKFGENFPSGYIACAYLILLESFIVLAVALFFSLCTSSLALATSLSFGFFLVGRSNQSLRYLAGINNAEWKRIVLRVVYDLFPALDRYNIRDLVSYSKPFPPEMISNGTIYFLVYTTLFLSMSYYVFRKKDLT